MSGFSHSGAVGVTGETGERSATDTSVDFCSRAFIACVSKVIEDIGKADDARCDIGESRFPPLLLEAADLVGLFCCDTSSSSGMTLSRLLFLKLMR